MNSNYYKGSVNGLSYKLYRTPGYKQKFAAMVSFFGSKDEIGSDYKFNRGIAHFIEHKLLVQSDLTDGYKLLTDMGVYANAATSNNHTFFEIEGIEIEKPLAFLIKSYFNPTFDEADLEREKKVIIRELNMVNDRPGTKLFYKMQDAYFNKEPIANPIIGTEESVNAITKAEMYECYNKFYTTDNSLLVVVGDISEEELLEFLKIHVPTNRRGIVIRNENHTLPTKTLIEHKEENINIPKFFMDIRFKQNELTNYEKICLSAYLDQLFGEYSKSFKELLEARLINKSFYLSPYSGLNYSGISLDSESVDPKKALSRIEGLFSKPIKIDQEIAEIFLKRYKASTLRISDNNSQLFYKMIEFAANGLDLFEFIDDLLKVDKIDFNITIYTASSRPNFLAAMARAAPHCPAPVSVVILVMPSFMQ